MTDDARTPGHRVTRTVSSTLRTVKRGVDRWTESRQRTDCTDPADAVTRQAGGTRRDTAPQGGITAPAAPRTLERDGITYRRVESGLKVVRGTADITQFEIPSEVDGVPVTVVGKDAFRGRTDLTAVVLPESLTTLGRGAFADCTGLTEIELPPSLTVVNAQSFDGCSGLHTVWLSPNLTRVGRRAFAGCSSLSRLPHFVNRGISAVVRMDRDFVEEALPTELEYVGAEAFRDCASLRSIVIPFQVTELPTSVFEGCEGLSSVWLHSRMTAIGDRAFARCSSLARLRVPESARLLGAEVFERSTTVVGVDGSAAVAYARENSVPVESLEATGPAISSAFGVTDGMTVEDLLASPAELENFLSRSEVRPATHETVRVDNSALVPPAATSRLVRDGAVYRHRDELGPGDVTITMVGDLMCSYYQQQASFRDGEFSFEGAFDDIKELLRPADLSIGNLEAMVASSYPFMQESRYIEDRPYLNAPPAFLSAVRNAGFDVVMNAQNHMYDTGAKGVVETIAAMHEAQLVHGGMQLHEDEPRHLLFDIRGMRIGIVAHLDPARQKMKQANFTDEALATFANGLSAQRVEADIAAARAAGAEFVLAYCHWGREYTDRVTKRQADFAQTVADAGADYIFGSHSHCPQPYSVLRSRDGRRVPVVYSGGNFLSDINQYKPYTDDTFIASLTLTRNDAGRVVVAADGYTPCRIVTSERFREYARVVPCSALLDGAYDYSPVQAESDIRRIETTMGRQYLRLERPGGHAIGRGTDKAPCADDEDLVGAYSVNEPPFAVQTERRSLDESDFEYDEASQVWRRVQDTARREAVIMCGGSLTYDRTLERNAHAGDVYEFRTHFRHLRGVLDSADLAVGSLGVMVVDEFPTLSSMPKVYAGRHYANARSEYVDALKYAGFDCLALAHPYNLDGGVRGIASTERAVRERGVVPSGLGRAKTPLFDVNGLRIAVLSHTVNEYRIREVITGEGADRLLNVMDEDRVRASIREARETGAQFVLSYLDCRAAGTQLTRADRLAAAEAMAEYGVDYVVCTLPNVVSRYVRHQTSDGRTVPIATGLGTLIAGSGTGEETASALLRIVVRPGADGGVIVDDSYIPLQRFHAFRGARGPVVPAHEFYISEFDPAPFGNGPQQVANRLGDGISLDPSRRVKINTHMRPQISPAEIARALGVGFSAEDVVRLGGSMDEPVHSIVVRREDLAPGCVAVLASRTAENRNFDEIAMDEAVAAGALMAVALEPHAELPTLVVDDPWNALNAMMVAIRERYSPVTVAVTGTAGKTTTKEMLSEVFGRHFRTLNVQGNFNTKRTAGLVVQKLAPEDEAYVQEAHGGSPDAAKNLSTMIQPDICIITSIGEAHLEQMGTFEAIIEGKMQIIDGMRTGGVLILNDDNPHLRAQRPDVRTVRYSTEDRDVDYLARDIRRVGDALEFEIVGPDGVHTVVINSRGMHNVSNALGAFAAGREAGIPAPTIVAGLSRHRASSTRQNFVEVGGYSLLVDAYNSNPISLESGVETLCEIPIEPDGRRIAVLGDMGEQGDRFDENHRAVGDLLARYPVDLVVCSGPGMLLAAQRLHEHGVEVRHYERFDELAADLHAVITPADIVLFKAAGAVDLEKKVVFPVFGRVV
ncbi:CapA family protein [Brevibacterium senegalense]|uniref:CapA family protein n=1 Tax=Brevibacterium senegalense TaxID=1033736 RepID=UPI0002D71EC4|nr:CapA family protein [Brevibacterium senegalense]